MTRKLLFTFFLGLAALAQTPADVRRGPTLPTHCYAGPPSSEFYYKTGTGSDLYVCSATDTWAATGAGVGGSQTANTVLAGPNTGSPAPATFRALTANDIPLPTNFTIGGVTTKAAAAHNFLTGVDTNGTISAAQPAASDLTNGTSGGGSVCLTVACTLVTPTIASFTNATHTHSNAAGGGQLTQTAVNSANLQGNGTKFQMASTVSGTSGLTFCTDVSGNATTTGCSTGSASNPTVSHIFAGSGEFGYVHNLNTLNPVVTCYDHSTTLGVIAGLNVTTPATLTTTYITVTAAETVDCSFNNGSGASGAQGATGPTGPAGPSPSGSGVLIGTAGVASTLPGTTTTLLHGNASGPPSFGAVVTADIAANAVTSAKMPVGNTRYSCDIPIGDQSASAAVSDTQLGPQKRICFIPASATIVEVDVAADGGTPNIIIGRNRAGSVVNIVSSALATAGSGGVACSNTGGTTGINGTTTCSATLQNTALNVGDYLELVSGTAGGTAKLMTAHVLYTVN